MGVIEALEKDVTPFVTQVLHTLHGHGIDVSENMMDHVCYRVESLSEYEECKLELSSKGCLLIENNIGGRPIATFKLNNPILVTDPISKQVREVRVIELPSPKTGSFYKTGLEHVEFVIADSFEHFISKHEKLSFSTKGSFKPVNPEISLKFKELGFSVKFHHMPLEQVIELEKAAEVVG
ncbi:Glyoxalase/Bleomycin resistance protein/Dihydroxybiphenyl dioxygenase [Basidiobolus meristosporus CBS 931.73]|uniref:Glyoxalase/Bleomycin resistance protein/Dihydroxybiphenyl dioxygenase n=1 Tax=Basidiobolus meristosporus CBS 931.73 TaxID=1314790 RepID=A0A1Y1Z710_9FUNG|nr:Glyoxalase/Bleomycin resistance protein/Dihydroxybiphenyl dioxygenase [Basidiobolus meristosporus CBS 931.73]|eukprot:ORY06078.1 Glyoxalase/Bleomycin resistance protein/Dihydroxybiphenyl dioxygenase [Basidiobolus meristosporus CBS 931.73]